jgi:hypothetical protein
VPPGDAKLTAAALDLLLSERSQERCRTALAECREEWRWSTVAQPLLDALPEISASHRGSLGAAALRAAAILAGKSPEGTP